MADIQPLRTLRYDTSVAGALGDLVAPPYDVIDDAMRAELAGRSEHNVVRLDLPESYEGAAETLADWREAGVLVDEDEPAMWALRQDYTAPDGSERTRTGFFARVRVEDYGAGRIRPHERTHPGPREDRLRLTRATRANLSPIFSLFPDSSGGARETLGQVTSEEPFAEVTDDEGTRNTLWRVADPDRIAALQGALADAELLIADGHHRYETARVYADEIGGEGDHRYVLMLLVALEDPGLLIFPTHRLLSGLKEDADKQIAIAETARRDFDIEELSGPRELEPSPGNDRVTFGYMDSHFKRPFRFTLKDQSIADEALPGMPEPYRKLDTAVLEAVFLRGALHMSEDDISHLHGLDYSKNLDDAIERVETGKADAGFFMRPTPVEQVREVAATGESMPPKSTYFYPKVPTGLVFNPLA
ncbi:MAG TPA: DUF1015 domain-containing protein [Thermoleophilaceae bacterium]